MVRLTPAHQILDRGSSATHSSHAANQRANISLIDRRSRWPRRVPYLALGFLDRPPRFVGRAQLVSVDKESHINVPAQPPARVMFLQRTPAFAGRFAAGG